MSDSIKNQSKQPARTAVIQAMVFCALFAALTAVCSQLTIPIQPVPINMATFSCCLAGALLGAKKGALSQLVFALMGAIGLPVFASFTGGLGILTGPTGGYIIGYIAAAAVIGLILQKSSGGYAVTVLAMVLGVAACYTLGTIWFIFVTKNSLASALMLCVVPFLFGDAVKILAAGAVVRSVRKIPFVRTVQSL